MQNVMCDFCRNRYNLVSGVVQSEQGKTHYALPDVGVAFLHLGVGER